MVIMTMPLPMIWALHLKNKEKVMLTGKLRPTKRQVQRNLADISSLLAGLFFLGAV